MDKNAVIVITGAAGFIGSYLVGYLNRNGYEKLILADEFDDEQKDINLHGKCFLVRVERDNFFEWLAREKLVIDFVFHLGARTDTTDSDPAIFEKLNLVYSKNIWKYCTEKNIPLVYASSAATYGTGENGYKDDHAIVEKLNPLNPYGVSKNEFDKWALQQQSTPPYWAGLKFFNVYGPNEYHKGRMASVMMHAFDQIQTVGKVKLFRSHKPEFKDGEQLRDFIFVEDVAAVCYWLLQNHIASGLYNLGTGKARTFVDLVAAIFTSLGRQPNIEFIDIPEDIRHKYQYFTQADMIKLRQAGYKEAFYSLETGIENYVKNFLLGKKYY